MFPLADKILQDIWKDMSVKHKKERCWVGYGIPTYLLSIVFASVNDTGMSFRWALLAYAHDILNNYPYGASCSILSTTFGIGKSDLEKLHEEGKLCLEAVRDHENDWGRIEGFPEEVIRRFVSNSGRSIYGTHIAHHQTERDFPVSPGYLSALIDLVEDESLDNNKKGAALEAMASYIMSLLPGCIVKQNLNDTSQVHQTDVLVSNLYRSSNALSDLFGRHILVECKNYRERIGVPEVGYFLLRMNMAHINFGIIFSKEGITGGDDFKNASALIRRSFHEYGSVCVIITIDDMKAAISENKSIYWPIMEKYEDFRFGGVQKQNPPNKKAKRSKKQN
jgi:hypothetical protein